jgi:small basic protein
VRLILRFRSHYAHSLSIADDVVLVAASLCGLGATIVISTAVDSGLGKTRCLLNSDHLEDIQIKVFVSTILFVLALSVSKCSMLMFLHHVADNTLQRVGIMIIGVLVLIWTVGVITGLVFECEMPRPWDIWTGKCIPMVSSCAPHEFWQY